MAHNDLQNRIQYFFTKVIMIQASKGISSKYCVNCMEIAPGFFISVNLDIKLINAQFRNN